MSNPPRRWFRFSLRTLFVLVTLLSIPLAWVAYQLNCIRKRHEFVALHRGVISNYDHGVGYRDGRLSLKPPFLEAQAPWVLRLLGEKGVGYIRLKWDATQRDVAHARSLFPEASVPPPSGTRPDEEDEPLATTPTTQNKQS